MPKVSKQDAAVYLMLVAAQCLNAGFHVLGSVGLKTMDPFVFACLRIGFATPILLVIAYFVDRDKFEKGQFIPSLKYHPKMAVLGLLGVTTNQVLFLLGLYYTNPINAAVTQPSIPVITAVIAIAIGQERLGGIIKPVGIILTFGAAVAMIMLQKNSSWAGTDLVLGNILLVGNCAGYSLYLVMQKPILKIIPPFTLTAWCFVYGMIGVVISVAIKSIFQPTNISDALAKQPIITWVAVAYASLIATVMVYVMMTVAVKYTSALTAAVFSPLQPVAATILSIIFLSMIPSIGEYLGAAGIITGMLMVVYAKARESIVESDEKKALLE